MPSPWKTICPIALVWTLAAVALSQDFGAAEYRDFVSVSGKKLRARLITVDEAGAKVKLRTSLGKELVIPISSLSGEDQVYIQTWDPLERLRQVTHKATEGVGLTNFMTAKGYTAARIQLKGKEILVDVEINGSAMTFLFDSGRVLTLLDEKLAKDLGVKIFPDVDFGEFPMADGSVVKVLAGATRNLALGDIDFPKFELGVVDLEKIGIHGQGVLGSDILGYFDSIVDWQTMKVYLRKPP